MEKKKDSSKVKFSPFAERAPIQSQANLVERAIVKFFICSVPQKNEKIKEREGQIFTFYYYLFFSSTLV